MRNILAKWLSLSTLRITGAYLLFGLLWIGTTDWLAIQLTRSQSQLRWVQSIKGWVFVGLSSALVFGLVYVREIQLRATTDRLTIAAEQLQVIHRVFRHNLRNELTVIKGYTGSVKAELERDDLEEQLLTAEAAVDRLEQVNEDLQILQEVEEPGTETIDLIPVINEECTHLLDQSSAVSFDLDLPDSTEIYGNNSIRLLIRRLLEILSIRHANESEHIHIELSVIQTNTEVRVVAKSLDYQLPELDVSSIQAGEERPLAHAIGVDLWVLKWLANISDGEIDIRVASDHTTITITLVPAVQLPQLTATIGDQLRNQPEE